MVATTTAVLTGALLVGDSTRGSLRDLALDRLGKIDAVLVSDHFFSKNLVSKTSAEHSSLSFHPVILFPLVSCDRSSESGVRRSSGIVLTAVEAGYEGLSKRNAWPIPKGGEVVLNAPLARDLGAKVGDEIAIRLPSGDQTPADSPLARKDNRVTSLPNQKVIAIVPDEDLGRFSLFPNQSAPRNVWASLETVQAALDIGDRVNSILAARQGSGSQALDLAKVAGLAQKEVTPSLEDFGLKLDEIKLADPNQKETLLIHYARLSSERMLLDPEVVRVVESELAEWKPQRTFTYVVNKIEKTPRSTESAAPGPISYSIVTGLVPDSRLGPDTTFETGTPAATLGENEIWLTDWAAKDQGVAVGDEVTLTFFEPESAHNTPTERSATLRVTAIVPLTEPAKPFRRGQRAIFTNLPTRANDPDLTPEVRGVTDQESISNWEAPFPVEYKLVRRQDDQFWENHRTTPKAYLSLSSAEKLWGSRWGAVTGMRFPLKPGESVDGLREKLTTSLQKVRTKLGFDFIPIREQAIAASSGTTPFDGLFLGLSMFVIGSAILLVILVFRLGAEQRSRELGLLMAMGFSRSRAIGGAFRESLVVAALGAAIGVALGLGYASLILWGLRSIWVGAIATPFLNLHVTPMSLALGFVIGFSISLIAMFLSLRSLSRASPKELLSGVARSLGPKRVAWSVLQTLAGGFLAIAFGLGFLATRLGGEAQAGAFLGSGACALTAGLLVLSKELRGGAARVSLLGGASLARLALRSAARNPTRSLLVLALMGSACFLLVAIGAFRLASSDRGSGGYPVMARSAQPIFEEFQPEGLEKLFRDKAKLFGSPPIISLRLRAGEDASCRNLYQSRSPQVIGAPEAFVQQFDTPTNESFEFAGAANASKSLNPWRSLEETNGGAVPAILDKNTAMYSLKLFGGIGEEFEADFDNQRVRFKVVGLLANSVFQGAIVVNEDAFKRLFPEVSGYRLFLARAKTADDAPKIMEALEDRFSDEGLDARLSREVLEELLSVQNTYISAFQTLGALGLLLGTFGLAASQARSVLERCGELALLQATGFTKGRLLALVTLENVALLLLGLVLGVASATVTVAPHMAAGGVRAPLAELGLMFGLIVAVGSIAGALTAWALLRLPLVSSLRSA